MKMNENQAIALWDNPQVGNIPVYKIRDIERQYMSPMLGNQAIENLRERMIQVFVLSIGGYAWRNVEKSRVITL